MVANAWSILVDTTAPAGVVLNIVNPSGSTVTQAITIATSDPLPLGYTVKLYGDVDNTYDPNVQTTEGASTAFAYVTSFTVKFSSGTATKTLYLIVYDAEGNASTVASDTFVYTAPAVVGQEVSSNWKVQALAGQEKVSNWSIRTAVFQTKVSNWNIRAAIGQEKVSNWAVRTAIGQENVSNWVVRATAGQQVVQSWKVQAAIGQIIQLSWNVLPPITQTKNVQQL